MGIEDSIIALLTQYKLPMLYLGAILFGETVIIPASFLSSSGFISPFSVLWVSLLGTMSADSLWFFAGDKLLKCCEKYKWCKNRHKRVLHVIERLTSKNPFHYLILSKFLYGTRIATIIYLAMRKVKFAKFLSFNSLGSVIWLIIIIGFSWAAGNSTRSITGITERIDIMALVLVLVFLSVKLGELFICKVVQRKNKKIAK